MEICTVLVTVAGRAAHCGLVSAPCHTVIQVPSPADRATWFSIIAQVSIHTSHYWHQPGTSLTKISLNKCPTEYAISKTDCCQDLAISWPPKLCSPCLQLFSPVQLGVGNSVFNKRLRILTCSVLLFLDINIKNLRILDNYISWWGFKALTSWSTAKLW